MKSSIPYLIALLLALVSASVTLVGCQSDDMLVPSPLPRVVTGAGGVFANSQPTFTGGGIGTIVSVSGGNTNGNVNGNTNTSAQACNVTPNGQFTENCNANTAVTLCEDGTGSCATGQGACSTHNGVCGPYPRG